MTDLATFLTREIAGGRVVEARGEIDIANAGDLRTALNAALDGVDVLIVSLSDISYLDSSALGVLIQVTRQSLTQRRKLLLVAPRESSAGKLLQIAAVDQIAPIYQTIDDAKLTLAD